MVTKLAAAPAQVILIQPLWHSSASGAEGGALGGLDPKPLGATFTANERL
jgi:hypothetical protein